MILMYPRVEYVMILHYVRRQSCIILSSFILEEANGKQPREMVIQPQMLVRIRTTVRYVRLSVTTFRTDVFISELKFVINYMRRMFLGNV